MGQRKRGRTKLKNKKTGEVATLTLSTNGEDLIIMGNDMLAHITKLSELKDYEDYEEPKGYFYVTTTGLIKYDDTPFCAIHKDRKTIGNYFETKKEAEKAVEKLKAFKRLKDKGFEFVGCFKDNTINYEFVERPLSYKEAEEAEQDLEFLFGGEE